MPADSGTTLPPCVAGFPGMWPYPVTSQAYQTHYFNGANTAGAQCNSATGCHLTGSPYSPSMPAPGDTATIDANYNTLITQLWTWAQGGLPSAQLYTHHQTGISATHTFSPQESAFIQDFLTKAAACNGCTGGICTCAAPAYCTQ
jgi:hypothetical protein